MTRRRRSAAEGKARHDRRTWFKVAREGIARGNPSLPFGSTRDSNAKVWSARQTALDDGGQLGGVTRCYGYAPTYSFDWQKVFAASLIRPVVPPLRRVPAPR